MKNSYYTINENYGNAGCWKNWIKWQILIVKKEKCRGGEGEGYISIEPREQNMPIQIGINRTVGTIMALSFLSNDWMFINVSAANQSTAYGNICGLHLPLSAFCPHLICVCDCSGNEWE